MKLIYFFVYSFCLYADFLMVAFSIFGINIYWYGIFYLIWFIVAYIFLYYLWKSKILEWYPKLKKFLEQNLDDLMIALIIWVLIGGRFWEVFIYEWNYFVSNPCEIIKVWHGGMSFFGWMVWVVLALIILFFIRKLSRKDLILLFDCLVFVVPLWIILWRFGNYLNQELYWLVVPDWAWWFSGWLYNFFVNTNIFHVYPKIDELLRINTNFISILFEWVFMFVLIFLVSLRQIKRKSIIIWLNSSIFLIFYSLFRFLIEYLRVDSQSQVVWKFTISQWLFFVLFVVWIISLVLVLNRKEK